MNRMKLVCIAAFVALTVGAGQVNAQDKPVTFGVKAGLNLSTLGGDVDDMKSIFKYQFGITTDIALTENLYILTGLDFQTKGAKYKPESSASIKYNPMYLQMPAHIGYKLSLAPSLKLVVNAGPYIAYGIGGKAKGGDEDLKLFSDEGTLKRLDYGVGGGIGVELGWLSVGGGYDLGLANISDTDGGKIRNRNAYVTVGIKF